MDDGGLNGLPSTSDSGSGSEMSKTQYGCSGIDSQHTSSGHKQDRLNVECVGHKGDADYDANHCLSGENLAKDYVENHSLMETEDNVIGSINTCCRHENNEKCGSACTQPSHILDEKDKMENEKVCTTKDCIQIQDAHCLKETNLGKGLVDSQSTLQENFELKETVVASEEQKCGNSGVISENGCQTSRDESPNRSHSKSTSLGVKRARISVDEHQPSVHVVYNSLTKASKEKLEGLLKQWSEWHAQHVCLSKDPSEVLVYGEDTFFPALHIGVEKTSAVSFWMDNQTTKEQNKGFIPLDGNSVPLYDRGYALGLTSADGSSNVEGGPEIIDPAARCFNCGSYTHSLRECPRPRDNAAVNIARKQHKSKRNQNASSRNPTRYYQDPPAGKYDGLRPGFLDAETRQILGLGELDPPPWLNRMRDMGYPPGYLDVDEDQPSGITIYGDEQIREQEDGEILETDYPKSKRKTTVEFPGINAPIPENADERLWTAASSSSDISRNRPQHRSNYSSADYGSRGYHRDRRSSADFGDDGPPGDPGHSSSKYSFHPRYGGYDNDYSPHNSKEKVSVPESPSYGRSLTDRSWRSPLYDEGSVNPSSFSFHYTAMERLVSPRDPDSGRPNNSWTESQYDRDLGRSSRTKDYSEGRHHRSWR